MSDRDGNADLRDKIWLAQWLREILVCLCIMGFFGFAIVAAILAPARYSNMPWLEDLPLGLAMAATAVFLVAAIRWGWQLKRGERLQDKLEAEAYARELEREID